MPLACFVFFVSGFAALTYQIVWQRLLVIFSGSDVHSATVIVAAFMAGLGCGSIVGGQIADRLPRVASLWSFAVAELAIAGFGLFSASLYYDVLYLRLGHLAWSAAARAAILFGSLLWPTFFMGVSLPLLARALTTEIDRAAAIAGALYGWNTLGAAAGAFLSTWWLLPNLGLKGSLQSIALLNVLAAIAVVPLVLRLGQRPRTRSRASSAAPRDPLCVPFAVWALIYGLAGFLALSLEIVWFRLIGVMLKATAFTFGTLLAVYLSGLGLGATLGTLLVRRIARPGDAFLAVQALVGVYAGLGLTLLLATLGGGGWLSSYFGSYEALDARAAMDALRRFVQGSGPLPGEFLALYFGLPAAIVGPATVLMGASFPLLQQAVQTDIARVGSRVGILLTANIAGSALGSFLTGWFCLAWFGTAGTLKLLVVVSALFPLLGLTRSSRRTMYANPALVPYGDPAPVPYGDPAPVPYGDPAPVPYGGRVRAMVTLIATGSLAVVATAVLLAMPDARSLWGRLHGATPRWILFGEDGSGTSVLKIVPENVQRKVIVFVNGVGQSWIPYGGVHTVLGALPAFIHPNPRDAAVIGLGSGDTLFGVAGRRELERITCIEIIRPQLETLKQLHRVQPYAGLHTILTDGRIDHVSGDGRLHVMRAPGKYDLIEADALRPMSAYAGNLYSDAYFTLVRDRLAPGGLAVSWSPTARVHNTFVKVFPHVLSYGDIVIGSNESIALHPAAIRERLADPDVQTHFRASGVDILALLAPYLDRAPRVFGPSDDRGTLQDINTDLFPKDELGVPLQSGR